MGVQDFPRSRLLVGLAAVVVLAIAANCSSSNPAVTADGGSPAPGEDSGATSSGETDAMPSGSDAVASGSDAVARTDAPQSSGTDSGATGCGTPSDGPQAPGTQVVSVSDAASLQNAVTNAKPGDEITLEDGTYAVSADLFVSNSGTPSQPIFVRSRNPLKADIQLCDIQGFTLVNASNWIFENLYIEGVCYDNGGETGSHAFHIEGSSDNVILRGNTISNFKSHVKVNNQTDPNDPNKLVFPQNLWILHNTWLTTLPIPSGGQPENVLNIDGGGYAVVRGNAFVDHVAQDYEQTSASNIYFKMGAHDYVVEQNLVVCQKHVNVVGDRRGIYSGDADPPSTLCDTTVTSDCTTANGLYRNNIVMDCGEPSYVAGASGGLQIRNETNAIYAHNTEYDDAANFYDPGASVTTTASLYSNILFGSWGTSAVPSVQVGNLNWQMSDATAFWVAPDSANFGLKSPSASRTLVPRRQDVTCDFCGNPRGTMTDPGAIDYANPQAASCVQSIQNWYGSL